MDGPYPEEITKDDKLGKKCKIYWHPSMDQISV